MNLYTDLPDTIGPEQKLQSCALKHKAKLVACTSDRPYNVYSCATEAAQISIRHRLVYRPVMQHLDVLWVLRSLKYTT